MLIDSKQDESAIANARGIIDAPSKSVASEEAAGESSAINEQVEDFNDKDSLEPESPLSKRALNATAGIQSESKTVADTVQQLHGQKENIKKDEKGLRYFESGNATCVTNAWVNINGSYYYFGPDGYAVKYSQTLIGTDGKEHFYYFNGAGIMQTGWLTWKKDNTRTFFAQNSKYIPMGAAFTGWVITGGKTYYLKPSDYRAARYNNTLTGRDGAEHSYYFNGAGVMYTGWLTWKDKTRSYYDPSTGAAATGWLDLSGKTYYFSPSNLRCATYSQNLIGRDGAEHSYYFNGAGVMYTGWLTWKDKTRSYYDPSTGAAATGWLDLSGKTYYFSRKTLRAVRYSQRLTGRDGEKHDYYFSGLGVMYGGWITWDNGTKSYFEPNAALPTYGARYTGMHLIGGSEYFFSSKGIQRRMRVLLIGNSFTERNNLYSLLASKLGNAEVVSRTKGGKDLTYLVTDEGSFAKATRQDYLNEGADWDFVVFQDLSTRPIDNPSDYLASATSLVSTIRALGATPIIYGTWAYAGTGKEGESRGAGALYRGISLTEMHEQLQSSFSMASDQTGAPIADVGSLFADLGWAKSLFEEDVKHPSVEGSKKIAQVIADTILSLLQPVA